jgi:hypothetical protein
VTLQVGREAASELKLVFHHQHKTRALHSISPGCSLRHLGRETATGVPTSAARFAPPGAGGAGDPAVAARSPAVLAGFGVA